MSKNHLHHLPLLNSWKEFAAMCCLVLLSRTPAFAQEAAIDTNGFLRQRISIDENWRFYKYESIAKADSLIYDARPAGQRPHG